jgi:hypothetical protein
VEQRGPGRELDDEVGHDLVELLLDGRDLADVTSHDHSPFRASSRLRVGRTSPLESALVPSTRRPSGDFVG